jgi:Kef-type K+ transport system membrane component KefB
LSSREFVLFALQVALMLAFGLFFGQLLRRRHQPAVVGEMLAGILLGPTVVGALFPAFYSWLFLSSDQVAAARDAMIKLGMLLFLFIAGLDVDLPDLRRSGRQPILIGLIGTVVPIGVGVALVYSLPIGFWGPTAGAQLLPFALFVGMNLANSANPVIARVLMDLGLLRTSIGSLVMSSTIVDDLVNWTLFAVVLNQIAPNHPGSTRGVGLTILVVVGFFVLVLGIGRRFGGSLLHWLRSHVAWPTGFIGLTTIVVLAIGSLSEALGLHAFLGAFLVGAALGGRSQEKNEAHEVISHFVLSFFAPIYFVSMGMAANFAAEFDVLLVLVILIAAFASKIGAVVLGARVAGMPISPEVWAVAFGLNARGATGIILASVGLAYGLIDERIFVAMVVMAMVTSLVSGPSMKAVLERQASVAAAERESTGA